MHVKFRAVIVHDKVGELVQRKQHDAVNLDVIAGGHRYGGVAGHRGEFGGALRKRGGQGGQGGRSEAKQSQRRERRRAEAGLLSGEREACVALRTRSADIVLVLRDGGGTVTEVRQCEATG